MERPRKINSSVSRPRINALSPLQTFSPLSADVDLPKLGSPATTSASASTATPTSTPSLSRSGSMGKLARSLSGHERVFTQQRRRDTGLSERSADGVTTRILLVKAPASAAPDSQLRKRSQSSSSLATYTAPMSSASPSNSPPSIVRKRSFAAASFADFGPLTSLKRENANPDPFDAVESAAAGGHVGSTTQLERVPSSLSPEEVLDLARGLMNPVTAPESGTTTPGSSGTAGRKHQRRKSTGTFKTAVGGGIVYTEPEPLAPIALEPVEYVEMDEGTLLPFSNRPLEVKALLANPKNTHLLAFLEQAFPSRPMRKEWKDIDVLQWHWSEFYAHLTEIDRRECPDYEWVLLARDAVRHHSVSLWEKLGACLGCDTELMMAGEEDESPASWGGLGLGEEDEYDPTLSRVWIEGLEPVDAAEAAKDERELAAALDDYEDFGAAGGFSSNMATIGEDEPVRLGPTTAQRAASGEPVIDTFPSPGTRTRPLSNDYTLASSASSASSLASVGSLGSPISPLSMSRKSPRSRSFVGLQILTSSQPTGVSPRSPNSFDEGMQFERTPGNPLFVSSFNTLSLGPNLGRKQSTSYATGGVPLAHADSFRGFQKPSARSLPRRPSGTGFSESAVTFVSDSSIDGPFR